MPLAVAVAVAVAVAAAVAVAQSFLESRFLMKDKQSDLYMEYMEDTNISDHPITFLIFYLLGNWRIRTGVG